MINHCLRRKHSPVAGHLRPPVEVNILQVHKKIFVKQADVGQHFPAIGHRPPTAAKNVNIPVELAFILLPHPPVDGDAVNAKTIPGRMEGVTAIKQKHFAGNHPRFGVGLQRFNHCLRPAGNHFGIVVERDDDLSARLFHRPVDRSGKTQVTTIFDNFHFGEVTPGQGHRLVGGAVIGQDDFQVRVSLGAQGVEAGDQVVRAVVVGDDDGEEGIIHPMTYLNITQIIQDYLDMFF